MNNDSRLKENGERLKGVMQGKGERRNVKEYAYFTFPFIL
jgi:hypothetical protein